MTRTFDRWELSTRLALARQHITHHVADPLIDDAKAHWEMSGQDPWEALGPPEDFAATVAAQQPTEATAALDRQGTTPRGYVSGAFFALTVLTVPYGLLGAALHGWTFALTPARLAGGVLFVLTYLALYALPDAVRTAGHPRGAPWMYLPILATAAVTVAAFAHLPDTRLVTVPIAVVIAVAVVIALLQLGPAKPARTQVEPGPNDPAAWFSRLHGLLVGRHELPPQRADDLVAEACAHPRADAPADEFGPVEIYAAELARPEAVRQTPWWFAQWTRNLMFLGFVAVLHREWIAGWFG